MRQQLRGRARLGPRGRAIDNDLVHVNTMNIEVKGPFSRPGNEPSLDRGGLATKGRDESPPPSPAHGPARVLTRLDGNSTDSLDGAKEVGAEAVHAAGTAESASDLRWLEAMHREMVKTRYLTVSEVAEHFSVARSTIEDLPEEVLPFVDIAPTPKRQLKRYHPADVHAAPARLRAWREAQQNAKGAAYLAELRARMENRDRLLVEHAESVTREAA